MTEQTEADTLAWWEYNELQETLYLFSDERTVVWTDPDIEQPWYAQGGS